MSKITWAGYPERFVTRTSMVGDLEPVEGASTSGNGKVYHFSTVSAPDSKELFAIVFPDKVELTEKITKNLPHCLRLRFLNQDCHYHKYPVTLSDGTVVDGFVISGVSVEFRRQRHAVAK